MEDEEKTKFLSNPVESLDVDKPSDDDIVRAVGRWGRWQTENGIIMYLLGFFGFTHFMVYQFFVPEADHWCTPPKLLDNLTIDQWKAYGIPPSGEEEGKLSQCKMYDMNYTEFPANLGDVNRSLFGEIDCNNGVTYDTSQFTVTIENEWDLVCEKEFWAKTAASTYNAGLLFGVMISGQLADVYGRRVVMRMCWIMATIAGFLTCFSPNLQFFCITRAFTGAGIIGANTSVFVSLMELLDSRDRAFVSVLMATSGSFGYLLLTLVAYYVPRWRWLNFCISFPLLLMLPFLWVLPESIRWLISQKRYKEAYRILKKAAIRNQKEFPSYEEFSFAEEQDACHSKKHTFIDLFRFWNLRMKTLNIYFNWFVNSFVYYGISLGVNSLGGSVYINSFLSAGVEIPSGLLSIWTMSKFGRTWNLCLYLGVGGLACMATAFFPNGVYANNWPIVCLAMIGKFCVSASFGVIYILSAETFPTVVRNVGVGSSSMSARVGSIIAPYIDLLRHIHSAIPLVSYGTTSVLAGVLILLMPETKDQPIPETIEEADRIGRKIHRMSKNRRLPRTSKIKNLLRKQSFV